MRHGYWIPIERHIGEPNKKAVGRRTDTGEEIEVYIDTRTTDIFDRCSECGNLTTDFTPNYCPHCGAKMEGYKKTGDLMAELEKKIQEKFEQEPVELIPKPSAASLGMESEIGLESIDDIMQKNAKWLARKQVKS